MEELGNAKRIATKLKKGKKVRFEETVTFMVLSSPQSPICKKQRTADVRTDDGFSEVRTKFSTEVAGGSGPTMRITAEHLSNINSAMYFMTDMIDLSKIMSDYLKEISTYIAIASQHNRVLLPYLMTFKNNLKAKKNIVEEGLEQFRTHLSPLVPFFPCLSLFLHDHSKDGDAGSESGIGGSPQSTNSKDMETGSKSMAFIPVTDPLAAATYKQATNNKIPKTSTFTHVGGIPQPGRAHAGRGGGRLHPPFTNPSTLETRNLEPSKYQTTDDPEDDVGQGR